MIISIRVLDIKALLLILNMKPAHFMKTDLTGILRVDSSRAIADIAIDAIEENPGLFEKAWEIMILDEYPISMRAARVVDECGEKNPDLMEPFLDEMIRRLPHFRVNGVKRGMLRYLSRTKLKPTPLLRGYLTETCFDWLSSVSEAIAIRFYSMEILFEISRKEPAIRYELMQLIEEGIERDTFGSASRPGKIIKILNKELNLPQ